MSDEQLLRRMRDRFKRMRDANAENVKAAKEDIEFAFGRNAQWPKQMRSQRESDRRPVLEFNQLPQFIRSVSNDARSNKPAIKVRPADDQASKETAELYEGLVRAIENDSNAQQIYVQAHEQAVAGGFGYWRVTTEYEAPDSFNQKIVIKPIQNQFSAGIDPDYSEPDGCDARYGFVTEAIPQDEFKRKWPKADRIDFESDDMQDWVVDGGYVIVGDYYERVFEERELVMTTAGQARYRVDLEKELRQKFAGITDKDLQAAIDMVTVKDAEGNPKVRTAEVPVVTMYKATGAKVLETSEWVGEYVPIVQCLGEENMIDGKRVRKGLVADAKDPQRMYNYLMSTGAEMTGIGPKIPWVGPKGSFKTDENWETANTESHAYLEYDVVPGAPPPTRVNPSTGAAEFLSAAQAFKQDLKSTIGIYDPSLGNRSNETSGRAILAREAQGDSVTYHFRDNLANAIRYTGRVIVDLIPKVYDTERLLRLRNEDGKEKPVTVNKPILDPNTLEPSGQRENDLAKGRYEVVVDVGPSFQTRRQESAQAMTEFLKVIGPQAAPLIADKIARNMDWPNSDDVADRLQAMLPPQIQQLEAQEGMQDMPPAAQQMVAGMQQQMQQAQGMFQQMQAQMAQMQQALAQKDAELQAAKVADSSAMQKAQNDADKIALERDKIALEREQFNAQQVQVAVARDQEVAREQGEVNGLAMVAQAIMRLAQTMSASQQQMMQMMSAPRKTIVEYDGAGNPVASVSVPVTAQ